MKHLPLTKGKVAQVDDEDYYWLSQWNWFAVEINNIWYAKRSKKKGVLRSGESFEIYLHRVVTRCTNKNMTVDHKDHDGLNNQKSNLRICTKAENNRSIRSRKNSSSIYLGVSWDKARNKWQVQYMFNGKKVFMKRYTNEIEAAKAYDTIALQYAGEFANLNFKN